MDIEVLFGEAPHEGHAIAPEVVTPPVVPATSTAALVRFREDPAALRASALAVLDMKVKPVETIDEANQLADRLAQGKLLLKNIEARRKLIVEPIKREASDVDREARTWSEPIQRYIQDAERVLIAYQRKQASEAARQEEAKQAALRDAAQQLQQAEIVGQPEAIAKAETAIMHIEAERPAEPIRGFKTDAGSTSIRTRWKVEVVDREKVPPNFLIPDLKALQAAVDAGARQIEGCNVFPEDSLQTRTR